VKSSIPILTRTAFAMMMAKTTTISKAVAFGVTFENTFWSAAFPSLLPLANRRRRYRCRRRRYDDLIVYKDVI